MTTKPPCELSNHDLTKLIEQGYCRTSRRHNLVSRIDKPRWKSGYLKKLSSASGESSAEDQYRRVHSKDRRRVPNGLLFPASSNSVTGFRELPQT